MSDVPVPIVATSLHAELRALIASSQQRLAGTVNTELTRLHWTIGQRLDAEVLGGERASYGTALLDQLGQQLSHGFGPASRPATCAAWSSSRKPFRAPRCDHAVGKIKLEPSGAIVGLNTPQAREFYSGQAVQDGWSVRELAWQIDCKAFERRAIASTQEPDGLLPMAPQGLASTASQVFKDPYFLDFLGLRQGHDEADLEAAILRHLEALILELGRRLRCLVAIELKLGRFKAAHKGQMELYMKWLDKHERQPGEDTSIGLILCAESSREQVELLQMHKDGIAVAEYWTELPPKAELEQHLHRTLFEARERLARRGMLLEGRDDE